MSLISLNFTIFFSSNVHTNKDTTCTQTTLALMFSIDALCWVANTKDNGLPSINI